MTPISELIDQDQRIAAASVQIDDDMVWAERCFSASYSTSQCPFKWAASVVGRPSLGYSQTRCSSSRLNTPDRDRRKIATLSIAAGLATWPARFPLQGKSMAKFSIMPPELRTASDQLKMSPGIVSGGHVFLTGMTGGDHDGQMPEDPAAQMRNAFEKIGLILREAGLTFQSVVEMTTYHVGLRGHFDLFDSIRLDYLEAPYPAWTAVEVAGLRRDGAIVEIRVIASTDPDV